MENKFNQDRPYTSKFRRCSRCICYSITYIIIIISKLAKLMTLKIYTLSLHCSYIPTYNRQFSFPKDFYCIFKVFQKLLISIQRSPYLPQHLQEVCCLFLVSIQTALYINVVKMVPLAVLPMGGIFVYTRPLFLRGHWNLK